MKKTIKNLAWSGQSQSLVAYKLDWPSRSIIRPYGTVSLRSGVTQP